VGNVLGAGLLTSGAVSRGEHLVAVRAQVVAGIPGATAADPHEPPIAAAVVGAAAALLGWMRRPTAAPGPVPA
jgi:hypothetical protein